MGYRYGIPLLLTMTLILTGCEKDPDPKGHLKLIVTYPEAVVIPDQQTYFIQVPADGAEARLYDKDAQCWGIRDARIDVAWIEGKPVGSKYAQFSNEKGVVVFNDIPAGEYYLVVFARQLTKYTEKYIELMGGDTLRLTKNFTDDLGYFNDLEPWDYEVPEN